MGRWAPWVCERGQIAHARDRNGNGLPKSKGHTHASCPLQCSRRGQREKHCTWAARGSEEKLSAHEGKNPPCCLVDHVPCCSPAGATPPKAAHPRRAWMSPIALACAKARVRRPARPSRAAAVAEVATCQVSLFATLPVPLQSQRQRKETHPQRGTDTPNSLIKLSTCWTNAAAKQPVRVAWRAALRRPARP